ncbi:MAG: YbaB/EbfC family nucleoid-associated protein [Candidatus Coatesbacteria bacterium]|nr:YbaB/EbfC family nucleoid-associated protein [Candidatus Coatesbacteria bacterium]
MSLNMLKQMQKVKEKMAAAQEAVRQKTVEVTVGGGMVTVVANGAQEIVSISFEKQVVDPDDVEMLEDLVLSAVNDALRKSKDLMSQEMSKFAKQMGLPPQIMNQL